MSFDSIKKFNKVLPIKLLYTGDFPNREKCGKTLTLM